MALTTIGEWNGSPVAVTARFMPRFLWTTASIDIYVGSQCVIRTGGKMKFVGQAAAQFEHAGTRHAIQLSWGRGKVRSFPIKVVIDEQPIAEANAYATNWFVSWWPLAAALTWIASNLLQR